MARAAVLTACEVFRGGRQGGDGEGRRTGGDGIQRLGRKEVRLRRAGSVKPGEVDQRVRGV